MKLYNDKSKFARKATSNHELKLSGLINKGEDIEVQKKTSSDLTD